MGCRLRNCPSRSDESPSDDVSHLSAGLTSVARGRIRVSMKASAWVNQLVAITSASDELGPLARSLEANAFSPPCTPSGATRGMLS
jgi:hypothetical protein